MPLSQRPHVPLLRAPSMPLSPPVPAPPPPPVRIKAAPPPQPSPATLAASSAPPTPAAAGADPRPTPAAVGQPSLAHAHHQQHPGFAGEMGGAPVKKKSVPVLSRCAHSHCVADLSASVPLPFRLAKVPGAGGPNDPSGMAVMGRSSRNKPSALLKPRPGGGECPACGVLTADRWHNLPGEFVDGARADMGEGGGARLPRHPRRSTMTPVGERRHHGS